jgi:hypothetical protein
MGCAVVDMQVETFASNLVPNLKIKGNDRKDGGQVTTSES